jgi:CrcB protein
MKGTEFILLAAGAVLGAYLRFRIVESPMSAGGLPLNVLLVNAVGSFLMGVFSVITVTLNLDFRYTLFFAVGFCGSFTTMSSFALETTNLLESKRFTLATLNITANVGLSLTSMLAGREFGNMIMAWLLR